MSLRFPNGLWNWNSQQISGVHRYQMQRQLHGFPIRYNLSFVQIYFHGLLVQFDPPCSTMDQSNKTNAVTVSPETRQETFKTFKRAAAVIYGSLLKARPASELSV